MNTDHVDHPPVRSGRPGQPDHLEARDLARDAARAWFLLAPTAACVAWGWCLIRSYDDAVDHASLVQPDLDIGLGGLGDLALGAVAVLVGVVALTVLLVDVVALVRGTGARRERAIPVLGAVLVGTLLTAATALLGHGVVQPYGVMAAEVARSAPFVLGVAVGPALLVSALAWRWNRRHRGTRA